jgi:hypothetical protein
MAPGTGTDTLASQTALLHAAHPEYSTSAFVAPAIAMLADQGEDSRRQRCHTVLIGRGVTVVTVARCRCQELAAAEPGSG